MRQIRDHVRCVHVSSTRPPERLGSARPPSRLPATVGRKLRYRTSARRGLARAAQFREDASSHWRGRSGSPRISAEDRWPFVISVILACGVTSVRLLFGDFISKLWMTSHHCYFFLVDPRVPVASSLVMRPGHCSARPGTTCQGRASELRNALQGQMYWDVAAALK